MKTMRTYTELSKLKTYDERFDYLKLDGEVGVDTFGFDRYMNQALYNSPEWKKARQDVIIRDLGCDLGVEGFDVRDKNAIVHHMNPITVKQIEERDPDIFNPEYLVLVSHKTHNAIHYGNEKPDRLPAERTKGDTCPWVK